jgi:hypothetical protein
MKGCVNSPCVFVESGSDEEQTCHRANTRLQQNIDKLDNQVSKCHQTFFPSSLTKVRCSIVTLQLQHSLVTEKKFNNIANQIIRLQMMTRCLRYKTFFFVKEPSAK